MAMIYTLVTSAKEWLADRFCEDSVGVSAEAEEAAKDDVSLSSILWNFFWNFLLVKMLNAFWISSIK